MWRKLMKEAKDQGALILLNSDTNSHSVLWNEIETNRRGEVFEDFIAKHGLFLAKLCLIFNCSQSNNLTR